MASILSRPWCVNDAEAACIWTQQVCVANLQVFTCFDNDAI